MRFLPDKRSIWVLLPLLLLSFFGFSQDVKLYKIYSSAAKKTITVDELIKALNKTDAVFYGEEHDDSIGHILEATLLKKLAEAHPQKLALSMEMFESDCQNVLNEYLSGLI